MTSKIHSRRTPQQIAIEAAEAAAKAAARATATELIRVRELAEFAFGDERVDVRGWEVLASDAQRVGLVESLFVDMRTRAVRYLGIALSEPATSHGAGTVLVPVGTVSRPGDRRIVILNAITHAQLAAAPRVPSRPVTRADENRTLAAFGMATSRDLPGGALYAGPHFEERRLFADSNRSPDA